MTGAASAFEQDPRCHLCSFQLRSHTVTRLGFPIRQGFPSLPWSWSAHSNSPPSSPLSECTAQLETPQSLLIWSSLGDSHIRVPRASAHKMPLLMITVPLLCCVRQPILSKVSQQASPFVLLSLPHTFLVNKRPSLNIPLGNSMVLHCLG